MCFLFQNMTNFFSSESKLKFAVEKVYINVRISFQPHITKISSAKHNYCLMLKTETRFSVDYSCET